MTSDTLDLSATEQQSSLVNDKSSIDDEEKKTSLDVIDGDNVYPPIRKIGSPNELNLPPTTPTLLSPRHSSPQVLKKNPAPIHHQSVTSTLHKVNPLCAKSFCCCCLSKTDDVVSDDNTTATTSLSGCKEKCTCCKHWESFRGKVKVFIENKWFDNGILVLIFASSIVLVSSYSLFRLRFSFYFSSL